MLPVRGARRTFVWVAAAACLFLVMLSACSPGFPDAVPQSSAVQTQASDTPAPSVDVPGSPDWVAVRDQYAQSLLSVALEGQMINLTGAINTNDGYGHLSPNAGQTGYRDCQANCPVVLRSDGLVHVLLPVGWTWDPLAANAYVGYQMEPIDRLSYWDMDRHMPVTVDRAPTDGGIALPTALALKTIRDLAPREVAYTDSQNLYRDGTSVPVAGPGSTIYGYAPVSREIQFGPFTAHQYVAQVEATEPGEFTVCLPQGASIRAEQYIGFPATVAIGEQCQDK